MRRRLGADWQSRAPLPQARSEVAAAAAAGELVVVGGFLPDGSDVGPRGRLLARERQLAPAPGLPVAVNHAMAASDGRRVYRRRRLLGGDRRRPDPARRVGARSRPLVGAAAAPGGARGRRSGDRRAAGCTSSAASAPHGLATRALVLDLARRRWSTAPGPTPREHLAATAASGRVYALGGRLAGLDTNVATLQAFTPGARAWVTLPSGPGTRGGTGRRRRRQAGSSRSAAKSPPGRSRACTRTTSPHGAGRDSPICRRPATGSASSHSADASTPSAAARSRACTSATRTSRSPRELASTRPGANARRNASRLPQRTAATSASLQPRSRSAATSAG